MKRLGRSGSRRSGGLPVARASDAREPIHPSVTVDLPRGEVVVAVAEHPQVRGGGSPSAADRYDVVELHPVRRSTDAAIGRRPLTSPVVPDVDLAPNRRRDVARVAFAGSGGWSGARLLHESPPLRGALEEEVE